MQIEGNFVSSFRILSISLLDAWNYVFQGI